MKTLSDFKKRLKVGVKLQAIHHLTFAGRNENGQAFYKDKDLGIREISIVQSNCFALKTERLNGDIVDSYCAYPKAKECSILDENTIQIFEGNIPVLTYKFI